MQWVDAFHVRQHFIKGWLPTPNPRSTNARMDYVWMDPPDTAPTLSKESSYGRNLDDQSCPDRGLIMDYQHDIVSNVEASYPASWTAPHLCSAWRGGRGPVIYVVVRFRPGHPEVSARNKIFSGMKAAGRLAEGSPGAAIHDRVRPQANEVIVTKRRVGAFSTTDMETVLRAHNVTHLVLLGIATSGVVLSTVAGRRMQTMG